MDNQHTPPRLRFSQKTRIALSHRQTIIGTVVGVLFAGVLFTFNSNSAPLEEVFFSFTTAAEISVCDEAVDFTLEYVNGEVLPLTGQEVTIQFPQGILYVPGSIVDTSGYNVAEIDISDLQNPVLGVEDLNPGESVSFSLQYRAIKAGKDLMLSGATPRNLVEIQANEGVATGESPAYNILYPSLSILSLNPTSQTAASGDTTTRSFNVTNGGYGRLSHFWVTDIHGEGVELISSSVGTLNGSRDTIYLSGADFTAIGNHDEYFDSFETINITETFVASGCNPTTASSVLNTHWGCEGELETGTSANAYIALQLKTPNIAVVATEELSACFGAGGLSTQTLTLTNNGQGTAYGLSLDLFKSSGGSYDETLFSRILEDSISYRVGAKGTPIRLIPTQTWETQHNGAYACLGADAVGKVRLDFPNLAPGESYLVTFYTAHCCIDLCQDQRNAGWKYTLDYTDACAQNAVSATKVGQSPYDGLMTLFTETPSDIRDTETVLFSYTISSYTNEFPMGDGAHYAVTFQLPAGLSFSGNSSDLLWESGPSNWSPMRVQHDTINRTVQALFPLAAPFDFPKSELSIRLRGDCAAPGASAGEQALTLNVNYVADTSCTASCSMPILCSETTTINLHCPGNCAEGMSFQQYEIGRISYGQPDNNQDGKPDSNGSLDLDQVKRNRVMVGDTLKGTFSGLVHTSANHNSWSYGYATSEIELGSNLSAYQAEIRIYDASANAYLHCNQVLLSSNIIGDKQTFSYDFSLASLGGCDALIGFTFGEGDSVWLDTYFRVTGNIGGAVQEVNVDNQFYLSDRAHPTSSGDQYACDNYGGKFTMIGYFFKNDWNNNFSFTSCNRWVSQFFYLSIGDCCSNYDGGNLFPYEYRNWAHVKQARVVIPENYNVLEIRLKQYRTQYTNRYATQTVNDIQADQVLGDTLYFDLEQYYEASGGDLLYSDDGFRGKLEILLAPTCDVTPDIWAEMPWWFTFQTVDQLGGTETDWYDCTPDKVKFNPASLALSSDAATVDGLSSKVTWNLNVRNTTGNTDSDNAWLHLKTPSQQVTVLHVIDDASGDTLQMTGDIYHVGEIKRSKTRSFSIVATYSNCSPDYILAYSGYECSAYPTTFAGFTCPYTEMELHVRPKPAELQVRLSAITSEINCENKVNLSVEMSSVQMAHVDSLYLIVELPTTGSITLPSGNTALKYPLSSDFETLTDPTLTNHTFRINTWELEENIATGGLPGILQTSLNRLQIKFTFDLESHFTPGEYIRIRSNAKSPCGADLPEINLIYDPSLRYTRTQLSGLDDDQRSTWGVAWGDYDGDGDEDLAVTEYAHWWASYLYRNNGNGTFSKVSAGPFTADKGSNVGVTWGDYDNDGDLDLFAANNVRAVNHLYRNNGSGSFDRVNAGSISNYGGYCHSASWVDYDNDGHLDLFVADFMPTKFNLLYHNEGDGTFTEAIGNPIVLEAKATMSASWGDYDNDGLVDLFVPNARNDNNSLYHNDGNGQFTKITSGDIVTDGGNSLGASWGDFDNDGDLDLYVTNASNQPNFFYVNNGDGTFAKNTSSLIATEQGHSFGSAWADVDNDGDLDLYVTNDNAHQNRMYINLGGGNFIVQQQIVVNEDEENSAAAAFADYDNDGDLDLFVANNNYKANTLYANDRGNCNSWKCFSLEGSNSNRSAIGAKVRVKATIYGQPVWQMREIAGQTGGVSAQSTLKVYFGLGDATLIDSLIIEWPSGYLQYMTSLPVNECVEVLEEVGEQITGRAFIDENENCSYEEGEQVLPNIMLEILPDGKFLTTNDQGMFSFYRGPGDYTIRQVDHPNWNHPCFTNIDVTVEEGTEQNGGPNNSLAGSSPNAPIILPNQPGCEDPNLSLSLSSTVLRKGFRNTYAISYKNEGPATATNFELAVAFDHEIIPIGADTPWDYTEVGTGKTTYIWAVDALAGYDSYTIILTDSVSIFANVGEMTETVGSFRNIGADCDLTDNTAHDFNAIVAAIDPNDKLVFPEGSIQPTDTLTYKIRFQNVGSALAQKVVILDTLSPHLDPRTLRIGAASHDYEMALSEHGVLKFTFNYIMLADSNSNEPESHGFIQYRIAPYAHSPNGTKIHNRAAIQFDYEAFLHTNQVSNTIANVRALAEAKQLKVTTSPNPVLDVAQFRVVSIEDPSIEVALGSYEVFTADGQRVSYAQNLHQSVATFRRGDLSAGVYIVKIIDQNGFSHSGKFVLR